MFWQKESYESRNLCNLVTHLCVRYAYIVHLERMLHVLYMILSNFCLLFLSLRDDVIYELELLCVYFCVDKSFTSSSQYPHYQGGIATYSFFVASMMATEL